MHHASRHPVSRTVRRTTWLCGAALAAAACSPASEPPGPRPNVLLVVLDTTDRRTHEAWAALFAGIGVFAMAVVALPLGIWWFMVNDDTSIADYGAAYYVVWVLGFALATGLGLATEWGIFRAPRATPTSPTG